MADDADLRTRAAKLGTLPIESPAVAHPGEAIKTARESVGMSPAALAAAAGMDSATIYRIESGEVKKPQAKTLARIYRVLEMGEFAREAGRARPVETLKSHELATRYWELANELNQVGAEMARRLPPDEDAPGGSGAARYNATEYPDAEVGDVRDRA